MNIEMFIGLYFVVVVGIGVSDWGYVSEYVNRRDCICMECFCGSVPVWQYMECLCVQCAFVAMYGVLR